MFASRCLSDSPSWIEAAAEGAGNDQVSPNEYGNGSGENHNFEKTRANHDKNIVKIHQKITHVDYMMIHNHVKYLVQTRLRL